jgi:hypothetical protein
MSKIIITDVHLVKHKVRGAVVHLEFKHGVRVSLISKLGFSIKRDKNKIKLYNLQPVVGFSTNNSRLEFREKLREGLVLTYHVHEKGVEIIIEDLNREEKLIPMHREEDDR